MSLEVFSLRVDEDLEKLCNRFKDFGYPSRSSFIRAALDYFSSLSTEEQQSLRKKNPSLSYPVPGRPRKTSAQASKTAKA
jgi:metal-responsive CopG/Arc/MetJ family transcriptional regulator